MPELQFAGAEEWLVGRVGHPIPLPPGFVVRGGFRDPVHMLRLAVPKEAVDLGGIAIAMTYNDEVETTRRAVRMRHGWFDNEIVRVTGFCELRREPRSFRSDRMIEVIDWRTGQVFTEPLDFFEELGVTRRPLVSIDVFRRIKAGSVILMALAAVDGELYSDEVQAALRFADEIAFDAGVALTPADLARIERVLRLMRPDADDLFAALAVMRDHAEDLRSLRRAMRTVIEADERITLDEAALIAECLRRLAL